MGGCHWLGVGAGWVPWVLWVPWGSPWPLGVSVAVGPRLDPWSLVHGGVSIHVVLAIGVSMAMAASMVTGPWWGPHGHGLGYRSAMGLWPSWVPIGVVGHGHGSILGL